MIIRLFLLAFICHFFFIDGFSKPVHRSESIVCSKAFAAPVITADGPVSFCTGGSVHLTSDVVDSLQWYKDGSAIMGETSKTFKVLASGKYLVKTTVNGIDEPSNEIIVTVNELPIAGFTSNATGSNCSNEEISFTNGSTGTGLTYLWDFGDPNSGAANSSAELNPKHVFVGTLGGGTQTFTVKLTVTNASGCSSQKAISVDTKQLPDATLTDYSLTPFTNCQGGGLGTDYLLTVTNTSSTANLKYDIDWGDGSVRFNSNTFTDFTHRYTNNGYFNLVLTVTGASGCISSTTYRVFNGSNPSVSMGNPGNTQGCGPSTFVFPITNTEGNPPGTKYTVSYNDGSPDEIYSSAPVNITHTFTKSSCGFTSLGGFANSFHVRIVASNPCGVSAVTVEPINISSKPTAGISAPIKVTCVDKELTFTNTSTSGGYFSNQSCSNVTKINWTITPALGWTVSNGRLGNDIPSLNPLTWGSNIIGVKFSQPGNYTLTLKSGNGCGDDKVSIPICINPIPTANFTLDKTSVCLGSSPIVQTTNISSQPVCGINTYQWSVDYAKLAGCSTGSSSYVLRSGSLSSESPSFQFNSAGIYTLSLITINGSNCTSIKTSKTITVREKPQFTITAPTLVCSAEKFGVTANLTNCGSENPPTYAWEFLGANTTTSSLQNPTDINYPTGGTYTIKLIVTNDCGATTLTKTISVNDLPIMATIVDKTFCRGNNIPQISFSTTPTNNAVTYSWTNNNTSIGLGPSGSGNIATFVAKNTSSTVQTATITVTPKFGSCTGASTSFKIIVNPSAPLANAGSDQELCNVTSTTLAGNDPGSTFSGDWTQLSGPTTGIIFGDATKYNSAVSGFQLGQSYEFKWTINGLGICPSTSDIVKVTTNALPVMVAISDKTYCSNVSVPAVNFLTTPANVAVTYTWSNDNPSIGLGSSGSGSLPSFTALNSTNTVLLATITVTPKLDNCTGTSTSFKIIVNPSAPQAKAGADQDLCNTTSTTLAGNDPGSTFSGNWGQSSGSTTGIIFGDATKYNSTVSGLQPGQSYEFQWTINGLGACPTTIDIVKITVAPNTIGGGTSGTKITCGPAPAGSISLTGNIGNIVRWESSSNGANFNSIAFTGNIYNYPILNGTTYFRAVVQSGTCNPEYSDTSKVTVNPVPIKPTTTTALTYCLNEVAPQLSAVGNDLKWYSSLPTGANGTSVAPTPLTTTSGTFNYYVTQTLNGCEGAYEKITIKVNPLITNNEISGDQNILYRE